jgi:mono/diheme cytochrome c family protein
MTRRMMMIGVLGTYLIVLALGIAILREPTRQVQAAAAIELAAVAEGIELYAEQCVVCHGAAGEGIGAYPPLDHDGIQAMDEETLWRTIARGRYNTAMVAYSMDEGGIYTDMQVQSLVALLHDAPWDEVSTRVAELGHTPPAQQAIDITGELVAQVEALPGGEALAAGLTLYATQCSACHGANGEGSALAPALDDDSLRSQKDDAELARVIGEGVPGTLMAGWSRALDDQQVADVVALIRNWSQVREAGITLAAPPTPAAIPGPEAIAAGARLYGLLCTQCHGRQGFGTPLAPALNDKVFLSQTPDAAIHQIIVGGVPGTAMAAWGGYLTAQDITNLTAFLRSWEEAAPSLAAPPAAQVP